MHISRFLNPGIRLLVPSQVNEVEGMVVEEEGGGKGGAVGCEMRMCVCVCSVGLLCQGMRFSFDPVE